MTSVITAELLAFLSIPLAATLMSRGVGYADWLPWQARAAWVPRPSCSRWPNPNPNPNPNPYPYPNPNPNPDPEPNPKPKP